MMATAHSTSTHAPHVRRRPSTVATEVLTLGSLAWLGRIWLAASAVYAVVITCVVRWGSVDTSLWMAIAAGWQRYVVFAAGVTVSTSFLRMLVRNGATRRVVASGALVTMGVLAVIIAAWTVTGLAIEKVIYDRYGWPQELRGDVPLAWADLVRAFLDSTLATAGYYASGWIVGCCYRRWGAVGGTALVMPALAPAAAMELLVSPPFGSLDRAVLESWMRAPSMAVTVVGGAVVLGAAVLVARRLTRELPLC